MDTTAKEMLREVNEIYCRLQDKESRSIFLNKLIYSVTNENKYWHSILVEQDQEHFEKISMLSASNREIIIYGAGANCKPVLEISQELG